MPDTIRTLDAFLNPATGLFRDGREISAQDLRDYVVSMESWRPWVVIGDVTAASQASIEFTGLSAYRYLEADFYHVIPATNAVDFGVQVAVGGTYDTGANYVWRGIFEISGSGVTSAAATSTYGNFGQIDNTANYGINGSVRISNFNQNAICRIFGFTSGRRGTVESETVNSITHSGTSARDKLRFQFASGNVASGRIVLRGRL